jgi:hypothetical protein
MLVPNKDRIWAEAYKNDQHAFEDAFKRKFPLADSIPSVGKYLALHAVESRQIDAPMPHMYEDAKQEPAPKEEKQELPVLWCQGCKKEFDPNQYKKPQIAKAMHAKHIKRCPKMLDVRV